MTVNVVLVMTLGLSVCFQSIAGVIVVNKFSRFIYHVSTNKILKVRFSKSQKLQLKGPICLLLLYQRLDIVTVLRIYKLNLPLIKFSRKNLTLFDVSISLLLHGFDPILICIKTALEIKTQNSNLYIQQYLFHTLKNWLKNLNMCYFVSPQFFTGEFGINHWQVQKMERNKLTQFYYVVKKKFHLR